MLYKNLYRSPIQPPPANPIKCRGACHTDHMIPIMRPDSNGLYFFNKSGVAYPLHPSSSFPPPKKKTCGNTNVMDNSGMK